MSEILNKLASCEQVSEWVGPYDERLVGATGEPVPNPGANLREEWYEPNNDWDNLSAEVKRLMVPRAIASRVVAQFVGDEDWNRIVLGFRDQQDWSSSFPIKAQTHIFTRQGRKAWAAVGLCERTLGLAVFAQEQTDSSVKAKVQLVPEEVFLKLVEINN